jgi:diaminohydroxyphosphoribosylaminopyrimidine deaminase / 5-amino-6-(5-phosphoribosylamino)uracil reductase
MIDSDYMRKALHLALKGRGKTSPNPMVGSILVKGNKIISEGWHHRCGAEHAEHIALNKAGQLAKGARLYVTLEPCCHYGRTPPCVDQIIKKGIKEIIIGMRDPNPLTHGKTIAKLRRSGIKTKVGILNKELEQMNESFIKFMKFKMPFVVAKSAQSLDGKIATVSGQSQWITSRKTRDFARRTRDEFDAILVGINTVIKDNPRLNGHRKTKRLKKIIVDTSLKIYPKAKLFRGAQPADCIIATTKKAPNAKIKLFQSKGVHVIVCPQRRGQVHLKWLFKELAKREITSILMEGGAQVIGDALNENLVDKMHVYVAPKIMGDQNALSSIAGVRTRNVNEAIQLRNLTLEKIDEDILITGYVYGNH